MKHTHTKERASEWRSWIYLHRHELYADIKRLEPSHHSWKEVEARYWINKARLEIGYKHSTAQCDIYLQIRRVLSRMIKEGTITDLSHF
jgi:hypothetical protein